MQFLHQLLQLIHKGVNILEFTVDGGKTDVCNRIDILQLSHDELANLRGGNLTFLMAEDLLLDIIHQFIDGIRRDRSLVAGKKDALLDLRTIILFTIVIALNNDQWNGFYFLICRKSLPTYVANSSTTNR